MSYNPNIPQSTSKRAISQRQILINFQSIYASFDNNHSALGLGTQGKHTVLVLRAQGSDPTTSATQTALYQKLVGGIPNWFYRPNSNGTPIQMSYPSIQTGVNPSNNMYYAQQYSFCAGPFVVYIGKIINPNNNQSVVLNPNTTLRYVGLTVANYQGNSANFVPIAIPTGTSGNSFNITFNAAKPLGTTLDVYYLAIGN